MDELELFVGLKIPDTTAITAFKTLKKLGLDVEKVERRIYYKFYFEGDADEFKEKISKTDILINANKNNFVTDTDGFKGEKVLVKDIGDSCEGLINTLKQRLGFRNISRMEKGVLWILGTDKKTAEKIAKELLSNENYQDYKIL